MTRAILILALALAGCTDVDWQRSLAGAAAASCRQQVGCEPGSAPGVAPVGVPR